MSVNVNEYESREALAEALADALLEDLQASSEPLLRVSGGSTPLPLFQALARRERDWSKTWVGLVDERWVAADDPASNEGFVKREFLVEGSPAASARFVGLAQADRPVDAAGEAWAAMVDAGVPPSADALVLGMGGDGHFASLFPGMPNLELGLELEAEAGTLRAEAPSEPKERVSLNLAAIASSKKLYLHITGAEKRALFDKAVAGDAEVADLPISALVAKLGPRLTVYWAP
jgi:6-phosphogluconolactonase